jgi:hypothetical protein
MTNSNFSLFAGLTCLILAGGALNGSAAHADTQAYTSQNNVGFFLSEYQEFPAQVYYSCDEVQERATELLQTLGASQVNVDCEGGINPFGIYSAPHVTLNFDSVQASKPSASATGVTAHFTTIQLRGTQGCDLTHQILEQVKGSFDIQSLVGDSSCMSPDSPYSMTITVLVSE